MLQNHFYKLILSFCFLFALPLTHGAQVSFDDEKSDDYTDSSSESSEKEWKAKDYLFSLSIVKRMDKEDQKQLNTYINDINAKRGAKDMEQFINEYAQKNRIDIEVLEEKIDDDDYGDLYSLCKEVIRTKPREENKSLVKHWNKKASFFKERSIYYKPSKGKYIRAAIKSWKINPESNTMSIDVIDQHDSCFLIQKLENGTRYHVSVTKKVPISSLKEMTKIMKEVQSLYIKKNNNISSSLETGWYEIVETKEEDKEKEGTVSKGINWIKNAVSGNDISKIDCDTVIKVYIKAIDSNRIYEITMPIKKSSVVGLAIQSVKIKKSHSHKKEPISASSHYSSFAYEKTKDKAEIYVGTQLYHFKKGYSFSKKDYEEREFSEDDFKKAITILDERDENAINAQYRAKVEEKKKEVIGILSQRKAAYNNQLIDTIIREGSLTRSDIEQDKELFEQLLEIKKIYTEKLGEKVSLENLLIDLTQRALVANIISKNSVIDTEIFVELLQNAYTHINKISNNDIFLLIGNTGAGKSTAVSYLIGEKLKLGKNKLGLKVVEKKIENSKGPKIGQRVGTSETSYAQGFSVLKKKDKKFFSGLVVDCPGFGDTRGLNHTICANLSIDQSIMNAKSIKGIVLVVPVAAFLIDRGNSVFHLIQYVKDKFPESFETTSKAFSCFHMLVTKEDQYDRELLDAIKSGDWFSSIIKNISDDIAKASKNSSNSQYTKIHDLEYRKGIWRALETLGNNERITFIDIEDGGERKRLLKQYGEGKEEINKKKYKTSLDVFELNNTLGKVLKKSFMSWKMMLEKFLDNIEVLKINSQKIDNYKEELKKTEEYLKKLNNKTSNESFNELYDKEISKKIKKCERNIEKNKKDIEKLDKEMAKKQERVEKLSTGFTTKKVWELHNYEKEKSMTIKTYKNSKTRERLHDEWRQGNDDDRKNEERADPSTYVGTLCWDITIKKGYRIKGRTPKETKMLNLPNNESYKETELAFTGNKVEINYPVKHHGSKKIMFGIKTKWDGNHPLPSASLILTVYNIDQYEAEIEQINVEIKELDAKKARKHEYQKAEEDELERLNNKAKEEIKEKLESDMKSIQKKILKKKEAKEKLIKGQRRLSLILLRKKKEPLFLKQLANSLFKNEKWQGGKDTDENSVETAEKLCKDFCRFFEKNQETIYTNCNNYLKESPLLKENDFDKNFLAPQEEKNNQRNQPFSHKLEGLDDEKKDEGNFHNSTDYNITDNTQNDHQGYNDNLLDVD